MGLFGRQRLGVDFGTSTTVIYIENKGIALREPSILALNKETNEIVAFGREAEQLVGRTSDTYEIIRPIRQGTIVQITYAKQMLSHFIRQATHQSLSKSEVVISVPGNISKVERKALIDLLKGLGIHRAMLVEESFATAIGANLAINQPLGRLVVNIGGGKTDLATISFGQVIRHSTIWASGESINQVIMDKIREHYHIVIAPSVAESIKLTIGNAKYTHHDVGDEFKAVGRNVTSGVPEEKSIHASIVAQAINEVVAQIVTAIKQLLSLTQPEIAADIAESGIILAGGGALLKRLPERLHDEIGIPVHLVQSPLDCVVQGTMRMLKDMDKKSRLIEKKLR